MRGRCLLRGTKHGDNEKGKREGKIMTGGEKEDGEMEERENKTKDRKKQDAEMTTEKNRC